MDIFNEHIVKRKRGNKDYLKICGILCGSVVLYYAVMLLLSLLGSYGSMFVFPTLIGIVFLNWYLIRSFMIEYEYSVTNGYMIIDRITARSRRKRMIAFECRDIEKIQKYNPQDYEQKTFDQTLLLDDNDPESVQWCAELTHKDFGRTLVVFTPNDRILAAMKPFLRRQVAFHAFNRI